MRIILILFFLLLSGTPGYAQERPPHDPSSAVDTILGRWVNDLGSQLELFVNKGTVTGSYHTNVGRPDKSQSFPLRGLVEGDQITFSVNFKGFGSMTAWVGQVVEGAKGQPMIRTMWHNTKDIIDIDEPKKV